MEEINFFKKQKLKETYVLCRTFKKNATTKIRKNNDKIQKTVYLYIFG